MGPVEALIPDALADGGVHRGVGADAPPREVLGHREVEAWGRVAQRHQRGRLVVAAEQDRHTPIERHPPGAEGGAPRRIVELGFPQIPGNPISGRVAGAHPDDKALVVPLIGRS